MYSVLLDLSREYKDAQMLLCRKHEASHPHRSTDNTSIPYADEYSVPQLRHLLPYAARMSDPSPDSCSVQYLVTSGWRSSPADEVEALRYVCTRYYSAAVQGRFGGDLTN